MLILVSFVFLSIAEEDKLILFCDKVFPSADLDQAVAWSALGVFENAGQSCSAGKFFSLSLTLSNDSFRSLWKFAY